MNCCCLMPLPTTPSGLLKERNNYLMQNYISTIQIKLSYMKTIFFTTVIAAMLITVIACKSKAQKDAEDYKDKIEKTVKENSPANTDDKQKPKAGSPDIPKDMENILGEWTLVRVLRDENGNHKIDEEDEKTAITNTNYMKLNADGTCKFETVMDGRYEIVTEENGRKRIAIQDMAGTKYPIKLYIVSVSKNDLVINTVNAGGSGFEIYKRP